MTNFNFRDLKGQIFYRLTVISRAGIDAHGKVTWHCKCDCGKDKVITGRSLVSGNTKSCGCLWLEVVGQNSITHGGSRTPEHRVWRSMIERCSNPNRKQWMDYGGRGITVCDRWVASFANFREDMGARPSADHSIDRINNDGNYEPSNCRWATRTEQNNNKRKAVPRDRCKVCGLFLKDSHADHDCNDVHKKRKPRKGYVTGAVTVQVAA